MPGLVRSERLFQVLELALIALFVVTLIPTGALARAFGLPWLLLWLVALVGLLPGLRGPGRPRPGVERRRYRGRPVRPGRARWRSFR